METALDYLSKTESAARKLFEGIDSYIRILDGHKKALFVSSAATKEELHREFTAWSEQHQDEIGARNAAFERFFSEGFAQAALCGAVLHLAFKAVEVYSRNVEVPDAWSAVLKGEKKARRFAFGRPVRGVPLGLVIYAGRNQHMHYEDRNFREPTPTVFDTLARNFPGARSHEHKDPALDVTNPLLESLASNVTFVLGWRSYGEYYNDMRELLVP